MYSTEREDITGDLTASAISLMVLGVTNTKRKATYSELNSKYSSDLATIYEDVELGHNPRCLIQRTLDRIPEENSRAEFIDRVFTILLLVLTILTILFLLWYQNFGPGFSFNNITRYCYTYCHS